MTRFGAHNSSSDVLILILGSPICIIVGCVILSASRDPFFPMVEIALGYGLIVLGVAYPILTLLLMRYNESEDDKTPELEFHDDGRISLVINDLGTDEDE
tara:strand:+ start:275 stop:574 length:300 start_codon:yes stop_codon:yes gene_type:complete